MVCGGAGHGRFLFPPWTGERPWGAALVHIYKAMHSSPFTCGFTLHDEHQESAESAVQLEADSDTGPGEGVRRLWICQREVSISSAIYFPA